MLNKLEKLRKAKEECGCESLGKIDEIHDSWRGDVPCITIDCDHRVIILDRKVRFERANLTQYCWDGCLNLEFDTLRDLVKLLEKVGLLETDDGKELR